MGYASTEIVNAPQKITQLKNIEKISAFGYLSGALTCGILFIWGNNQAKEPKQYEIPTSYPVSDKSGSIYDVKDFKIGNSCILVINQNGELMTMGSNKFGLLGRNAKITDEWDTTSYIISQNVTHLACSFYNAAVVKGI